MSSDELSEKECPLCMEPFDFDDVHFYPCNCNYQICRFCWHRLRTDENGLCPACRQPYPEDPVNFQPLSSAEIQKIKTEKKQKQQKNKQIDGKKPNPGLAAYRVLQKNLVYVIGLSQRMADSETLKKNEFFGKFGKILKIAVGTSQNANNIQPTSYTAYVTYGKTDDALRAIQAVNNLVVDGRLIKASLGTTKYCSNFLKGQACHKQECMYLHEVADDELSFTKEDMQHGKHTECERRLHEQLNNSQISHATTAATTTPTSNINSVNNRPVNGHADLEARNNQNNTHKNSESDSEKPPPGFPKINCEERSVKDDDVLLQQSIILPKSSFEIPQGSSTNKIGNQNMVWDEKNKCFYTNDSARQNELFSSNSLDLTNIPAASSFSSAAPTNFMPRSHSEPENYEENFKLKFISPDIKVMTCDELERILLSSSVPPGFQEHDSNIPTTSTQQNCVSHGIPKGYRDDSLMQNYREPPVSSGINFFLDLYDDLGFDPFSESSKALADMLEEEKSINSTN